MGRYRYSIICFLIFGIVGIFSNPQGRKKGHPYKASYSADVVTSPNVGIERSTTAATDAIESEEQNSATSEAGRNNISQQTSNSQLPGPSDKLRELRRTYESFLLQCRRENISFSETFSRLESSYPLEFRQFKRDALGWLNSQQPQSGNQHKAPYSRDVMTSSNLRIKRNATAPTNTPEGQGQNSISSEAGKDDNPPQTTNSQAKERLRENYEEFLRSCDERRMSRRNTFIFMELFYPAEFRQFEEDASDFQASLSQLMSDETPTNWMGTGIWRMKKL